MYVLGIVTLLGVALRVPYDFGPSEDVFEQHI